jgi:hypothetical protein
MTDDFGALMAAVFDRLAVDSSTMAERRADFVFHMTDWIDDAKRIVELINSPASWQEKDAATFVFGYLAHVIPHLQNARRSLEAADAPGES